MRSAATCSVSIVVCAFSHARFDGLGAALASLRAQSLAPAEVILVVDHNDGLLARARAAFPAVRVLESRGAMGLSGARNTGFEAAGGDVVAFMDDDAVAESSWLERLTAPYRDDGIVGVGGAVLPVWESGRRPDWLPREFDWAVGCSYRGLPTAPAAVRNIIGCNMSFRRMLLGRIGGFRLGLGRLGGNLLGDEETELCLRVAKAGLGRIWYQPDAVVHHKVTGDRARLSYLLRRCYAEGIGKARLSRLMGSGAALASERRYVAKALTAAAAEGLADGLVRFRPAGLARSGVVPLALGCAVAGYVRGRLGEEEPKIPANTG